MAVKNICSAKNKTKYYAIWQSKNLNDDVGENTNTSFNK